MEVCFVKKTETLVRREKLDAIREMGYEPYPNDFTPNHTIAEILAATEAAVSPAESGAVFSAAGRVVSINSFGKAAFLRFRDRSGQIQVYVRKDKIGEKDFALYKLLDVGDHIGVTGALFTTKTGEWTLEAQEFRLLCKALKPLPEKFHGLKDPEKRYRQRYLDLITNAQAREIFITRAKVVRAVRNFLEERGFLEVETPMMQPVPGGAEATPFVTHHNALDMDLFLRIAPELYLKRLVVGGFERVFEINRNFRNEGISTRHNPEFTMLEFYLAYATYEHLMDLTEEMFLYVARQAAQGDTVEYQGERISFARPWRRLSMEKAMSRMAGMPPEIMHDREKLLDFAQAKNVPIQKGARAGKVLAKLFDALVEPRLIQPTFITGYPVEISPLSRRNAKDPRVTDRFELFIAGREIANGFSELNDPEDQRERFLQQVEDREAGDGEAHPMDEDYIEALSHGMPPTAGEGIGIDRLAMLFTNAASIREVILFPHMRHAPGQDRDEGGEEEE
jgi:lysyl-tRNA synthetase class 2